MSLFLLFAFGAAIGSFIGVISDRYREDLPVWDKKIIGGRSHCEFCRKKLAWYELIPIASFVFQKGKCRHCKRRLGFRYLFYEAACGIIFVSVGAAFSGDFYFGDYSSYALSGLWMAVFSLLFLVSLIDYRLKMIPDEANLLVALLGLPIAYFQNFGPITGSYVGHYALLFGLRDNVWINHIFAAAAAGLFFAGLILVTRGRGMGGGDMKLAAALGMAFGWPDVVFISVISFVIGSIFGIGAIIFKKEKMKSRIAFGPFLALSAFIVFMFGYNIVNFYFSFFGM